MARHNDNVLLDKVLAVIFFLNRTNSHLNNCHNNITFNTSFE